MKVAYVFSTPGHTASYKLGRMILPQLEEGRHGAEVAGMFFFDDNAYILRRGDPLGERVGRVARDRGIPLMLCDQCASERGLAESDDAGGYRPRDVVEGVRVGCFPGRYAALAGNPPDVDCLPDEDYAASAATSAWPPPIGRRSCSSSRTRSRRSLPGRRQLKSSRIAGQSGPGRAHPPRHARAEGVPGHREGRIAMARCSAATARVCGGTPAQVGETMECPEAPNMAVAVALDRALAAARRLRDTLDTAAHQQAELATQLARVLALAGPCAPHEVGCTACSTRTAPDEGRTARPRATRTPTSLSPREREVLRLLATGNSNRRIAAALCLSPRTVQRHVANIYPKIGAHNKSEATAYALCHRLA